MNAVALKIAEQSDPTLSELARDALADANGDKKEALVTLETRLASDARLRRQLAEEAIAIAMFSLMTRAQLNNRGAILRAVGAGREGVKSLATGLMRSVLDMPLLDGTRLRSATADDLHLAINHYRKQITGMNRVVRFLGAILKLMPPDGCVGDVIADDKANDLWRRYFK